MSIIKSGTTTTTAYSVDANTDGDLVFIVSESLTAMTISASGAVSFSSAGGFDIASANITTLTSASATVTNLLATSLTVSSDALISGLTVGKGTGAGSTNTVVGAGALTSNVAGAAITAIGSAALAANTVDSGTAVGRNSLNANTTGTSNTAVGHNSALLNTTGANNVAIGAAALYSNTTASNNTAVGYQAGYSVATGAYNTYIGRSAGANHVATGNSFDTYLGYASGFSVSTGYQNTFVGANAGEAVTTGAKNTILGRYSGNQDSLDIRTASNKIVLSDGDGSVGLYINSGALEKVRFKINVDYSNTYDYVAAGNFGTNYADLIPNGTLVNFAVYLVQITTNYGTPPYYQDTVFIFRCVGTNGSGSGAPIDMLTSHHVNNPTGKWSIRVSSLGNSTSGIQGVVTAGPGSDVPASITVYAQRIS